MATGEKNRALWSTPRTNNSQMPNKRTQTSEQRHNLQQMMQYV